MCCSDKEDWCWTGGCIIGISIVLTLVVLLPLTLFGCNPDISRCYGRIHDATVFEVNYTSCSEYECFHPKYRFAYDDNLETCSYTDEEEVYHSVEEIQYDFSVGEEIQLLVTSSFWDPSICTPNLYYRYKQWLASTILLTLFGVIILVGMCMMILPWTNIFSYEKEIYRGYTHNSNNATTDTTSQEELKERVEGDAP